MLQYNQTFNILSAVVASLTTAISLDVDTEASLSTIIEIDVDSNASVFAGKLDVSTDSFIGSIFDIDINTDTNINIFIHILVDTEASINFITSIDVDSDASILEATFLNIASEASLFIPLEVDTVGSIVRGKFADIASGASLGLTRFYETESTFIEWFLPESTSSFDQTFETNSLEIQWVLPPAYSSIRKHLSSRSAIGYGVYLHYPWPPFHRIAELRTAFDINPTFEHMDIGRSTLQVHKDDSPDYRYQGALLVITDPVQPTWCGVVTHIKDSLYKGNSSLDAVGIGAIFDGRQENQNKRYPRTVSSTHVIRQALSGASSRGSTGIRLSRNISPAAPLVVDYTAGGQSVLNVLQDMHEYTDWEWWIDITAFPSHLNMELNWGPKQGQDLSSIIVLQQAKHINSMDVDRDLSKGKEMVFAIGGFGNPLYQRSSVSIASRPGGTATGSKQFFGAIPRIINTLSQLPAGLRNERSFIDVMTDSNAQLEREARRDQRRNLESETSINVVVNNKIDWNYLRIGNYITIQTEIYDGPVRIIGSQPDKELQEIRLLCQARLI